jgi:hypothetical protein
MSGTIHKPLRLSFLIICLSYLTACKQSPEPVTESQSAASAPAWYSAQTIEASGYWIGFGDALTLEQAKALARADLAATFKAEIRGSLRIEQDFDGDTLEQRAQSRLEQFTAAEFDDLRTLKSEQQAGRYYLVLGYDHRPLHQRLVSRLQAESNPTSEAQQLPTTSRLYQQLQTSLGRVPTEPAPRTRSLSTVDRQCQRGGTRRRDRTAAAPTAIRRYPAVTRSSTARLCR